jgi:UDP-glucose 4-epimerase
MSWLVTGGAGYIGSHVVEEMISREHEVIVYDNLSSGRRERLPECVPLIIGDIFDKESLFNVFRRNKIEGVINLAALKSVTESYENSAKYEQVNYQGVKSLIEGCRKYGVEYFLQSSTAAVYGQTIESVVGEDSPTNPISPYGKTKLLAEQDVSAFTLNGYGQSTSLRYFNVIGTKRIQLRDESTANLLPIVLKAIADGKRPTIFGSDYPTKDGTCIRDFIHVKDVAVAHVKAVEVMTTRSIPRVLNIGSGVGYSVLEMVNEILKVKNSNLEPQFTGRRTGDIPSLIASTSLASLHLNFTARESLHSMIVSSIE